MGYIVQISVVLISLIQVFDLFALWSSLLS